MRFGRQTPILLREEAAGHQFYGLPHGQHILMVVSDHLGISDDGVFPLTIPGRGKAITTLAAWWFEQIRQNYPDLPLSFVSADLGTISQDFPMATEHPGQTMLLMAAAPLSFTVIVARHLSGDLWDEYARTGLIGETSLEKGLVQFAALRTPISTLRRSTRGGNTGGRLFYHQLDEEIAATVKHWSLALYDWAYKLALQSGIIIAEATFQFGIIRQGKARASQLALVKNPFTPDSAKLWRVHGFTPGEPPESLDDQFIRHQLLPENGLPPILPAETLTQMAWLYEELVSRFTGEEIPEALAYFTEDLN